MNLALSILIARALRKGKKRARMQAARQPSIDSFFTHGAQRNKLSTERGQDKHIPRLPDHNLFPITPPPSLPLVLSSHGSPRHRSNHLDDFTPIHHALQRILGIVQTRFGVLFGQ